MRCKKHPSDLSSSVGVCSSCLRDRLFSLIAAQEQHARLAHAHLRATVEDRRNPEPPLAFPRSVSPYVSRRKSDDPHRGAAGVNQLDHRFYSTPQVGPAAAGDRKKKRFSLLSSLFRTRSEKFVSDSRDWSETPSSSPSWFSTILPGRRKKQLRMYSLDDSTSDVRRYGRGMTDRGMSPAGTADEEDDCYRSPSGSAHSWETSSPQPWRRTPMQRKGKHGQGRNVSGLAFCLSPLVRASPSRQWKQKGGGGLPPEMGEVRASPKPHLSTAASFCANRSRKIADFGRANRNR